MMGSNTADEAVVPQFRADESQENDIPLMGPGLTPADMIARYWIPSLLHIVISNLDGVPGRINQ